MSKGRGHRLYQLVCILVAVVGDPMEKLALSAQTVNVM